MSFEVYYRAWNTTTGGYITGDEANHTMTVRAAGSDITGLIPFEIGEGTYGLTLADAQLPAGQRFAVYGTSSTGGIVITGETGVRPVNTDAIASTTRINAISADGGTITLIRGDDYTGLDLSWESALENQWELSDHTLLFGLEYGDTTLETPGTIVTPTGTQVVSVPLTSAQTGALPITEVGRWDIQSTNSSTGKIKTILRGKLIVLESFTSPPA